MIAIIEARYECDRDTATYMDEGYKRAIKAAHNALNNAYGKQKWRLKQDCAYCYWHYAMYQQKNTPNPKLAEDNFKQAIKLSGHSNADLLGSYLLWEIQWGRRARAERLLEDLVRLDRKHPTVIEAEGLLDLSEV